MSVTIQSLGGFDPANPGAIGGTTPAAGAFTTLSASGLISANGGQIAFPATQNASAGANTLDDYEEGTFTPSIGGDATAGSQTYGAQRLGTYTKIGNRVAYTVSVNLTAKDAATAGNIVITGLPFAAANLMAALVGRFSAFDLSTGYTVLNADINSNTIIRLWQGGDNVSSIALPAAGLLATSFITLNGIYEV
jgi:hypothetical protein